MLSLANLEEYQVFPSTGFLPSCPPAETLPSYYEPWESIGIGLPGLIQDGRLAEAVARLSLLSVEKLEHEPEWRRAYVVLGYIASGLLWGVDRPIDVQPLE